MNDGSKLLTDAKLGIAWNNQEAFDRWWKQLVTAWKSAQNNAPNAGAKMRYIVPENRDLETQIVNKIKELSEKEGFAQRDAFLAMKNAGFVSFTKIATDWTK